MRRRLPDLLIIALLFVLPLLMFWGQTVGGKTLIPADNLYQFQPFAAYRDQVGAPTIPQNDLVSDLVLQNYQFKTFIRQSIAQGEIPLWNPHQFSGIAFFAAGQQSMLYPFSLIYYVLPLAAAYGWFMVSQLWLAGIFMYLLMRGLGIGRSGGAVAGVTYQLSAFFVISAVFPMIVAAAVWLPLILLMIEFIITQRRALRGVPASVPWIAIGAIALGCMVLAGHVEITYYTLIVSAYYAGARLIWIYIAARRAQRAAPLQDLTPSNLRLPSPLHDENGRNDIASSVDSDAVGAGFKPAPTPDAEAEERAHRRAPLRHIIGRGLMVVALLALGVGLGAIQFIPTLEAANDNFRSDAASLDQVLGWALPKRDAIQFLMPNFYGSPAQHSYFDVFSGQTVALADTPTLNADGNPLTTINWGVDRNYVEVGAVRRHSAAGAGALRADQAADGAAGDHGAARRGRADLHVRLADLRHPVLRLSGDQSTAFALPLGLSADAGRRAAGGLRDGCAGARSRQVGAALRRRADRRRRAGADRVGGCAAVLSADRAAGGEGVHVAGAGDASVQRRAHVLQRRVRQRGDLRRDHAAGGGGVLPHPPTPSP